MTEPEKYRIFRCASCGTEFRVEGAGSARCTSCGSKVLILLEGESLSRKKCSGCTASSCST
ncbi:MAG TPA: hypothetical protein PK849_12200 [Synergistales bacterium]|nr:hypothetical protein [Synergistaceae bacterium]PKL01818.1 MAG: hypothetical protein CVV55_07610 [Synergistetes bacterium HGW-Synergistetes-2]HPE66933.1 hypothetical protein [Synergistales bacterium]HRV97024.1 hypothetical protein [Aminobacteriaceae bacterium]MDD3915854.1 hypothetical protein [Synergistaceae bacterium]